MVHGGGEIEGGRLGSSGHGHDRVRQTDRKNLTQRRGGRRAVAEKREARMNKLHPTDGAIPDN
jgi:hypothetical protein